MLTPHKQWHHGRSRHQLLWRAYKGCLISVPGSRKQWHHGRRRPQWWHVSAERDVARADAFGVMISRISGIVGGTLISLIVAIIIYPSSATQV